MTITELLEHYLKNWNLSNVHKIKETDTGHIYKVDSKYGRVVLKIFTELGVKDELGGTFFLRATSGNGTVKLYKHDNKAQLMEYLPGENLYRYSKEGKEDEATLIFINIIKKIHSSEGIEERDKLMPLNYLFKLFDRVNPPKELAEIFKKAKELSERLLSTQTDEVLLHGDLHHENVLKNSEGEYVCFDPKGVIGDPSYELGTTLKNPWGYPEISQDIEMFKRRAKRFSIELNLPLDRIIGFAFIHLCLSIGWAIEDGCEYSHQQKLLLKVVSLL
ncbi:MAG: phosphotransferase [Bdellovibrionaceae bacterium]|nr:phosphotransferase [Pseudobdellovibrionaceae bacterium]